LSYWVGLKLDRENSIEVLTQAIREQGCPEIINWIERFWRTIKREYIYLNPEDKATDLCDGIKQYIQYYNTKRPHQGLEHHLIPINLYQKKNNDAA